MRPNVSKASACFTATATVVVLLQFCIVGAAQAQFDDGSSGASGSGAATSQKFGDPLVKKIKIGVKVKAVGGPCKGIVASMPVPIEWPEQKVVQGEEDLSHGVQHISYRNLEGGGAKQMVIAIPSLTSGEEAHAIVTFEITRRDILPPDDTSMYKECPKDKLPKNVLPYLGISPLIESTHPKIIAFAKEATADKADWEKVEAIYDAVRSKVKYQNGPIKGALRAITDGTGDCEEMTSLFIAACRATGIPARTVHVPDHCYPEFYLVDGSGKGTWFPCQAAGSRAFGGIPEHRPILQKGDNFHDPDRPNEKLHYVSDYLKGSKSKGSGEPQVQWVEEWQ
ncbi:MAG TPA: transglutaminase family protein [Pirellulales bacterium]